MEISFDTEIRTSKSGREYVTFRAPLARFGLSSFKEDERLGTLEALAESLAGKTTEQVLERLEALRGLAFTNGMACQRRMAAKQAQA